jgi:hypothetical protein
MKHELTNEEIASACNEYILKHHYPPGEWNIRTAVDVITLTDSRSLNLLIGVIKPEEVVGKPLIFKIVVEVSKKL